MDDGRKRLLARFREKNKDPERIKNAIKEVMHSSIQQKPFSMFASAAPSPASSQSESADSADLIDSTPAPAAVPDRDPVAMIQDALLRIEDNDGDRGAERNNAGWSMFTRSFGSSLAAQIAGGAGLSPNQLKQALTMLSTKHGKQAGELPTHEELAIALGEDPTKTARAAASGGKVLEHGGDHIAVKFPFDREVKDRVKAIDGARWNKVDKKWEVPFTSFDALLKEFPDFGVDDELYREERVFDAPPEPAANAGMIRADGNQIRVSFPFERGLVDRVKSVRVAGQKGKWNGRDWVFPNNETTWEKLREAFPEFELAKAAARLYSISGVRHILDPSLQAFVKA